MIFWLQMTAWVGMCLNLTVEFFVFKIWPKYNCSLGIVPNRIIDVWTYILGLEAAYTNARELCAGQQAHNADKCMQQILPSIICKLLREQECCKSDLSPVWMQVKVTMSYLVYLNNFQDHLSSSCRTKLSPLLKEIF